MLETDSGVDAYLNDSFPGLQVRFRCDSLRADLLLKLLPQGETSALLNLARTIGGFSVTYFQVPWATKHGALQTFGCEAAAVAGLFILIIPALQVKGKYLRVSRYPVPPSHAP